MTPPRRLRVLMTTDAVGGVWTYASALSRALCQRGFEVVLVTLGPVPREDQIQSLDGVPGLTIEPTDLALEWIDPQGLDVARARERLNAIERRVQPDVVHLNSYREATGDWRSPVLVVAHSCVRTWWRACRGVDPDEPRWLVYVDNVAAGLSAADRWLAPTAAFRDTIAALYRPVTEGVVIWNGIDAPSPRRHKQPFILAAGRLWDEAKNVEMLAHVAPRVPWPIRAAGPAGEPAHSGVLPPGVEALGELPHGALLGLMRHASVLAAPAVYEPFGLTVLEAAASGCALVLSDIATFRELWDGAALFVDARDEAAWQAILTHVTNNAALREDLQRRALGHAPRYSLATMTDGYAGLYEELATQVGRHRTRQEPMLEVRA